MENANTIFPPPENVSPTLWCRCKRQTCRACGYILRSMVALVGLLIALFAGLFAAPLVLIDWLGRRRKDPNRKQDSGKQRT